MATLLKTLGLGVILAASILPGHSQTKPKTAQKTVSEPTSIRGHRMGETGHEFLMESHLLGSDSQNDFEACLNGGMMKAAKDPMYRQCPQMVAANNGGDAAIFSGTRAAGGPIYKFRDGKLTVVVIELGPFDEALGYLVEKYGKPSSRSTSLIQNAFGAKFELGHADWQMADGCSIMAEEKIDTENGFRRYTDVGIFSKEEVERMKAEQSSRPNPLN
jgi:hypothetical protein